MRTRQRKARKGSCHSSLFVTDARSGHFAPISGIIVHSFDLQSLFQSFRSFEKRFTLCSSSKKKYGTDRQKFPGSLNLRSPFGRKTFLRQNKVNPEDDNPQPTLPATIKESHAPLRWSRLFLPTTCATMDRSGRTKSCLTRPILMFSPLSEFIRQGQLSISGIGQTASSQPGLLQQPVLSETVLTAPCDNQVIEQPNIEQRGRLGNFLRENLCTISFIPKRIFTVSSCHPSTRL